MTDHLFLGMFFIFPYFHFSSSCPLGGIQVLRHQGGGWVGSKMEILDDLEYCKSSKSWVGGPKKVKNMMT